MCTTSRVPENVAFCVTLSAGPKMSGVKHPILEGPTYPNGNTYGEQNVRESGGIHAANAAHKISARTPNKPISHGGKRPESTPMTSTPSNKRARSSPVVSRDTTVNDLMSAFLASPTKLQKSENGDRVDTGGMDKDLLFNLLLKEMCQGDLELLHWKLASFQGPATAYEYATAKVDGFDLQNSMYVAELINFSEPEVIADPTAVAQKVVVAVKALGHLYWQYKGVCTVLYRVYSLRTPHNALHIHIAVILLQLPSSIPTNEQIDALLLSLRGLLPAGPAAGTIGSAEQPPTVLDMFTPAARADLVVIADVTKTRLETMAMAHDLAESIAVVPRPPVKPRTEDDITADVETSDRDAAKWKGRLKELPLYIEKTRQKKQVIARALNSRACVGAGILHSAGRGVSCGASALFIGMCSVSCDLVFAAAMVFRQLRGELGRAAAHAQPDS
jgi:hypothetical protein